MSFEMPPEKQIDETDKFKTFAEEIDYLIDFFSGFSNLTLINGHGPTFFSGTEYFVLNQELIDGSVQTLKSIKLCCSIGSFSDANTLIRKFRDDLILFVYILNIIELRQPILKESLDEFKANSSTDFVNSILNIKLNMELTKDEQAVTAWFKDSVSNLKRPIKKKLEFQNYMKVLKQNTEVNHILEEYNLHKYWETLRVKLNDYVHNNGLQYSRHNVVTAYHNNLELHLKNINTRVTYISSFFLVLILMVRSSIISSSNYISHLECDMEPPQDGQYFIASFVQTFIDKKVAKLHPELKQFLKDNNISMMKIE